MEILKLFMFTVFVLAMDHTVPVEGGILVWYDSTDGGLLGHSATRGDSITYEAAVSACTMEGGEIYNHSPDDDTTLVDKLYLSTPYWVYTADTSGGNCDYVMHYEGRINSETDSCTASRQYICYLPPGSSADVTEDIIAFSVRIGQYTSADPADPIPFNIVEFNEGGAYNSTSGIFNAPKDGLYSMNYEVMPLESCSNNVLNVQLRVNGIRKSESLTRNKAATTGAGISLMLATGDSVYLTLNRVSCQSLSEYDILNKFSGHLVQAKTLVE